MDEEEQQPLENSDVTAEESKAKRRSRKRRRPKNGMKITKKSIAKVDQTILKEYKKYVRQIKRRKSCRIVSFETLLTYLRQSPVWHALFSQNFFTFYVFNMKCVKTYFAKLKKHIKKTKKRNPKANGEGQGKGKGKGKKVENAEQQVAVLPEDQTDENMDQSVPVEEPVPVDDQSASVESVENVESAPEEQSPPAENPEAEALVEPSGPEPLEDTSAEPESAPPAQESGIAKTVSDAAKSVSDTLGLSSSEKKEGGKRKKKGSRSKRK